MRNAMRQGKPPSSNMFYTARKTLKQKQQANGRTLALNGTAWRKLRAHVLAGEPLCRHCTAKGLTVLATEVDHHDNNPANNALQNLQPLCRMHHSLKTARDMGYTVNERMGCDASGKPLDPSHPWNKAASAVLTSPDDHCEKSPATDTARTDCLLRSNAKCKDKP